VALPAPLACQCLSRATRESIEVEDADGADTASRNGRTGWQDTDRTSCVRRDAPSAYAPASTGTIGDEWPAMRPVSAARAAGCTG
jgi:hypothetical protein